jgi:hydrogenase maturation protease
VTAGPLVVGFGSLLRSDDGVGRQVAERLADDPRMRVATVIGCHQLTPELALDISQATWVVMIDASPGTTAGSFTVEPLDPVDDQAGVWSHHLSPSGLIALAVELYGRAPKVTLVRVGVESLEVGERLSPVVEAALPRIVDAVADLVSADARRTRAADLADGVHA